MTPAQYSLFKQLTDKDSSLLLDEDFAAEWVNESWKFLLYFSDEIKNNEEIVHRACAQDTAALQYASPRIQNNRDFILSIAKEDSSGEILNYLTPSLSEDFEIIMTAISKNGLNLCAVIDTMKDNPEVVLFAINKDPRAFIHASYRLRSDPEIALAAMQNAKGRMTTSIFNYVGIELWDMFKSLNDEQRITHLQTLVERKKLVNKHLQDHTLPKIDAL